MELIKLFDQLQQIKYENKIRKHDFKLLVEAFRRKHFLNSQSNMLGLGTAACYRSKYFALGLSMNGVENKSRGVCNWYKLTKQGEEIIEKMENILLPISNNNKSEINHFLFDF